MRPVTGGPSDIAASTEAPATRGEGNRPRVEAGPDPATLGPEPIGQRAPLVFGIVAVGARRRRPSDIFRVASASVAVALTAAGAGHVTTLERRWFGLLAALPSWVRSGAELVYEVGSVGTVAALLVALLATRRWRLFATLFAAGTAAFALAAALRALADVDATRAAHGIVLGGEVPEFPVMILVPCTTVAFVAGPYLLRRSRSAGASRPPSTCSRGHPPPPPRRARWPRRSPAWASPHGTSSSRPDRSGGGPATARPGSATRASRSR
jgi:hypothetical protein